MRITHLPTGLVVEIQDEKSQHKNKAKAHGRAAIPPVRHGATKQRERERGRATSAWSARATAPRRSGPTTSRQDRVTDHRIGTTIHNVPGVLEGELDPLIDALMMADQADRLRSLTESDDGPDDRRPRRS